MKKVFFLLLTGLILLSCDQDTEKVFIIDNIDDLQLNFVPYDGGATLHYNLPKQANIYGIKVKYKNFKGDEMIVRGSYVGKEMDLFGFVEAEEAVPAEITLIGLDGQESAPIQRTFSTLTNNLIQVFDRMSVHDHWSGYRVEVPSHEGSGSGKINIYHVGINAFTNKLDTINTGVVSYTNGFQGYSFTYTKIPDTIKASDVTIVIKVEDSKGNFLMKKTYEKPLGFMMQADTTDFSFAGGEIKPEEMFFQKIGAQYLFDGDKVGWQTLKDNWTAYLYNYHSATGVVGDSTRDAITIEFNTPQVIAGIKLYADLNLTIVNASDPIKYASGKYQNEKQYPSHVVIYGTNDNNSDYTTWDKLGSFYQDPSIDNYNKELWWCYAGHKVWRTTELEEFKKQTPLYLEVTAPVSNKKHKYLKIRILETFSTSDSPSWGINRNKDFAIEELDIFVGK